MGRRAESNEKVNGKLTSDPETQCLARLRPLLFHTGSLAPLEAVPLTVAAVRGSYLPGRTFMK